MNDFLRGKYDIIFFPEIQRKGRGPFIAPSGNNESFILFFLSLASAFNKGGGTSSLCGSESGLEMASAFEMTERALHDRHNVST